MLSFISYLNQQQFQELKNLIKRCRNYDGNTIPLYEPILKKPRPAGCTLLYYHQQKLEGFLALYFFYETACEIALLVAPERRHCGIGRQMLASVLPVLRQNNMKQVIFSKPLHTPNNSCKYGEFFYSEFTMKREQTTPAIVNLPHLYIRSATVKDISFLCTLDKLCFDTKGKDMAARFQQLLEDKERSIFIAELSGHPVGKAHILWQPQGAHFSDIAIHPDKQGQGFGQSLLAQCINHALKLKKTILSLDVETKNNQALKLYTRLGFFITNACDFWRVPLQALPKLT